MSSLRIEYTGGRCAIGADWSLKRMRRLCADNKCLATSVALTLVLTVSSIQPGFGQGPLSEVIENNNRGQYREALDQAQSLLGSMPNDERVHFNLGRAYEGLNRMSEAVEQYQACQRLAPTSTMGSASKESIERICKRYPRLRSVFNVDGQNQQSGPAGQNRQYSEQVQNSQSRKNLPSYQSTVNSGARASVWAEPEAKRVKNYVNYGVGLPVQSIPDEPAMRAQALRLSGSSTARSGAAKSTKDKSNARSAK